MSNRYVVSQAKLRCTVGSKETQIQVASQHGLKVEGKAQASEKDKTLVDTFGSCALCNGNPCSPVLQEWKITSNKRTNSQSRMLLERSYIQCVKKGLITITDPNQNTLKEGGIED